MPVSDKIDYDRGVIINIHSLTGMDVFMYADDPGKFLDAHGNIVPDVVAKEAGYDTEKLAKARVKKDRKEHALTLIDQEFADDKDTNEETVLEIDGFKVVTTGLGRHHVIDPDGNRLNNFPLTREAAEKLANQMGDAAPKTIETGSVSGKKK